LPRVRGALELRLPSGDAALRPLRARQGDADLRRRDRTHGARGPVCRVRVGRTGSKDRAALPPERHREADRPLEDPGTRRHVVTHPIAPPPMVRRFGLIHATALNMTNMIGIGPFITIPLLMSALGGPQAMLGWLVALVIVMCDGMVWSELGAALPGSGGSFAYLRQGYGAETVGRLMGFLFVWQFVLSGPLEIASGYIGFARYLAYTWKGVRGRPGRRVADRRLQLPLLLRCLLHRRRSRESRPGEPTVDSHQHRPGRGDLPRDQSVDYRRGPVAGLCAG